MRIIELLIDDIENQEVGIDGIALVKLPAHQENWLAFNQESRLKQPYEVLSPSQMDELANLIISLGEDENTLLEQGFQIVKVEEITNPNHFTGDIGSNPNITSMEDGPYGRIRYKYVGPKDEKNRPFCSAMLSAHKVYAIEDINRMSSALVNEEISKYSGYYDIFQWRGSYNCRHRWVQLTYAPVDPEKGIAANRILNDSERNRLLESQELVPAENTTTTASANKGYDAMAWFSMVDIIDNYPLFDNIEEAEQISNIIGCKGYHIHNVGGKDYYMPCERHPEQMDLITDTPPYTTQTGTTIPEPVVKPRLTFSYDDDKMEITGAAIIPNKLIIRTSVTGEPYYVYFSPETTKKLAFKFMKDKRLDATNIEHTPLKAKDTYVVESWIVENEMEDKSRALGLNYPVGTWVITMKTDSKEVWSDIKSGKYAGFSVEGFFEEKAVFNQDDIVLEKIKNILNQTQ